jgi:hypothetical protein
MYRLDATPMFAEVLANQPSVAVFGSSFAAQQNRDSLEQFLRYPLLNAALGHEPAKPHFVFCPRSLVLLVRVEQGLSRREKRLMHIVRAADPVEEIAEVVSLREAGELRHIVQSDINETCYTCPLQDLKEVFRGMLGETDRVDLHDETSCPNSAP